MPTPQIENTNLPSMSMKEVEQMCVLLEPFIDIIGELHFGNATVKVPNELDEVTITGEVRIECRTFRKEGGINARWAVLFAGNCCGYDGTLSIEPSPSNRDEEFLKNYRFDDLRHAIFYAWRMMVTGRMQKG
jgi:hypothetical protein